MHFSTFRFLLLAIAISFAVASARAQNEITDQLTQERQAQTGTAITIIFDDSGSMNTDQKLAQAKAAFTSWLRNIPEDYKLSLITFQRGGRINIPLGAGNRAELIRTVAQLTASSATPICAALRLASRQISERRQKVTPYERHVVLLFTDGQETEDSRGAVGVQENIRALRAANVEVAGVGFHGEGEYMRGAATRYYSANDEASLATGLAKIDVEIGDTSDLVVSADELEAMKTVSPPPPPVALVAPIASEPAAIAPPISAASPAKKQPSWILLAVLAMGFFILRSLIKKRR